VKQCIGSPIQPGPHGMLEARSVSFCYHRSWALDAVSFQIRKGEFVGVIGPNGSGKSTLLKLLYRFLSPQKGEIICDGVPLARMPRSEIARRIAVVPQETVLLFPVTAFEIVLTGRSPHLGRRLFEGEKDLAVARQAMEWTDTLSLSDRPIDELSGGERKRVFIARALAQEPEIILLDEPTANLDIHHQIDFLKLILRLYREKSLTIVMASHDMNIASEFCDRLILLEHGSVFRMGTAPEVITPDNIERVYGCRVWIDRSPVSGMPRISLLREEPT
jgi:iron complex transport system ATP-binding protein